MVPLTAGLARSVALHIPDGFLSLPIAVAAWIVAAALLWLAARRSQASLGERHVPLMGVMAAFIFAAQMINFPVAGGTSGHLLGGVLAAIALGPWSAMLAMASVIGLQALLFQDGGLVVMGANILNMGLLTALLGYGLYRGAAGRARGVRLAVAGFAAWLSVVASALVTALQLWLSGAARLDIVVPAMLGVHVLIGIGEALITVAALAFITRARPDLIEADTRVASDGRGWVAGGLVAALAIVLLAPFASVSPDGLERVAGDAGFLSLATDTPFQLLPDYTVPFLGDGGVSTIVAGLIGALVVAVIAAVLGRVTTRSERPADRSRGTVV